MRRPRVAQRSVELHGFLAGFLIFWALATLVMALRYVLAEVLSRRTCEFHGVFARVSAHLLEAFLLLVLNADKLGIQVSTDLFRALVLVEADGLLGALVQLEIMTSVAR